MALIAQTRLEYSRDGKKTVVEEGKVVKDGTFPPEVLGRFKEIGSVAEPPTSPALDAAAAENEELKRQVAELEAQLAEAKKSTEKPTAKTEDKK